MRRRCRCQRPPLGARRACRPIAWRRLRAAGAVVEAGHRGPLRPRHCPQHRHCWRGVRLQRHCQNQPAWPLQRGSGAPASAAEPRRPDGPRRALCLTWCLPMHPACQIRCGASSIPCCRALRSSPLPTRPDGAAPAGTWRELDERRGKRPAACSTAGRAREGMRKTQPPRPREPRANSLFCGRGRKVRPRECRLAPHSRGAGFSQRAQLACISPQAVSALLGHCCCPKGTTAAPRGGKPRHSQCPQAHRCATTLSTPNTGRDCRKGAHSCGRAPVRGQLSQRA